MAKNESNETKSNESPSNKLVGKSMFGDMWIHRKIGMRFAWGLLVIAALFFGYQKFAEFAKDPDVGSFDSKGMILALEYSRDGDRAVLFGLDGKEVEAPKVEGRGGRPGDKRDLEASWSADGQRIFISSNRETKSFAVHRWNPATNTIEAKRDPGRFQSAPFFDMANDTLAKDQGLIISGGFVFDYNVKTGATRQILPPVSKERVENSEGGTAGPMDQLFDKIGTTFRSARWARDRSMIYAVMKGDAAETALVIDFNSAMNTGPQTLARGNKVALETLPDGRAVVMVRGFKAPVGPDGQPPQDFQKPFENALVLVNVDAQGVPQVEVMFAAPDDKNAVGDIAVSPNGDRLAAVVGKVVDGQFVAEGLVVMPIEAQAAMKATPVMQGNISQVSWSPDGERLIYIKSDGANSNIYSVATSGTGEKQIGPDGRYGMPKFSPQTAGS